MQPNNVARLLSRLASPRLQMVRAAGWTIALQLATAILTFFIGFGLARMLGTDGFGAYDYADAWIEVLFTFGLFGFDRLLVRKLAVYRVREDWSRMRGILNFSEQVTLIAAIVMGLAVAALGYISFWASTTANPTIVYTLWLAMLILPLRALVKLREAALQGLGEVVRSHLPDFILRPLLLLTLIIIVFLFFRAHLSAPLVMLLNGVAITVSFLVSLQMLRSITPEPVKQAVPNIEGYEWMMSAVPLMLLSGMNFLNIRVGSLVLGSLAELDSVGLFGATVRLATLIMMTSLAVNKVLAPTMSRLYAEGNITGLQNVTAQSIRGILLISLPIGLVMIFGGNYLLSIFGSEFPQAHGALVILSIGYMFNAMSGSYLWLLMMTEHEKETAAAVMITSLIHVGISILLTALWGLDGTALATTLGVILRNVVLMWLVEQRLHIDTLAFLRLKLW